MFGSSFKSKISRQPSLYPPLAFHLARVGQLLSSTIVLSILSFFIYYLRDEQYTVPWTFILLLTVSIVTIVGILITGALHYYRTLPQYTNLSLNAFNTILWAVGFALLTWYISPTLGNRCTYATWNSEGGIMICRLYKALTTFIVTGLLSTAFSLFLDLRTRRTSTYRGTYNPMEDTKHLSSTNTQQQLDPPQEDPYSTRSLSHEISRPYKVQRPIEAQQFGYSAPSEQTTYDGPTGAHLA